MIVADNPDPDPAVSNIVEKMIRKALQIAASQAARVEMEALRIRTCHLNTGSELGEEGIFQFVRDGAVFR